MPRKVYIRPQPAAAPKRRRGRTHGDPQPHGGTGVLVRLESEDPRLLDSETKRLYEILAGVGSEVVGPFPLPVRVLEGQPAGAGVEKRIHRRTLEIVRPTQETIQVLDRLQMSRHVSIAFETEGEAAGEMPHRGGPAA
jgi:ribosomal protein S10